MVYDVNLIATLLLGWTAMCQGKMMDNADEPKSVIKEYKAGNLNEKLTIDHVTYDNPRRRPKTKKEGKEGHVTLNDDHDDDDDDDSPPTTMLTEPSSLKPIGMKRLKPTKSQDPEPTIPEDLLKEVSLMKIPQYDLPKTITSIQTQPLNSFSTPVDDYENDDIMKPEYSKYFNDDYQVPVEYQKFNFNTKPVYKTPNEDAEKHVKIEIGKHKVKTVVDKPIIITKTKLIDYNTLDSEDNKSDVYKSFYNGYNDHYGRLQKDRVRSGCYNCYRPLYNPYKRYPYPPPPLPAPRPQHYPLGSPYVPRYANRYARSRYVRPVYRPKPPVYMMRYPPPRYPHHYRAPYRRPRPPYLPPRPPLPPPRHPYWYPPPPPPPTPPKPSCPPSKVVKEVHVHHFPPPSKIEKIPVPVAILEANHNENYDHDIIEPGPYDEEELDSDEHAELQEINAHLDEALRNNKQELDKNLQEGQRYIIEEDRGGSEDDEYKKPNYNKIIDQALVNNRKELEKNLKDGPDIVKTAYLPDDGIYNLHKFADKNHLYNFPRTAKAQKSSSTNDYKLHLESLKDFEPRKILQDGTPIRYILTNKMSYNHTKPRDG